MNGNLQAVSTVLDMGEQMHFKCISFLERLSTLQSTQIKNHSCQILLMPNTGL